MKIISHRANLNGIDKENENNPSKILDVIKKYDVEVDVWFLDNKWFLGHDKPQYLVDFSFFNEKMWIHCKNLLAVSKLKETELNWFWHEKDQITLTSKKFIWCYPNVYVKDGITVEFEHNPNLPDYILGICTDYPEKYGK